jgi:hypothetical protein
MENYHIVSVQSPNYRGRKKTPGRLIYDPSVQRLGVFIGYCVCNNKIIADQRTVDLLTRNVKKSKKRFTARVLLAAAKKLEE